MTRDDLLAAMMDLEQITRPEADAMLDELLIYVSYEDVVEGYRRRWIEKRDVGRPRRVRLPR